MHPLVFPTGPFSCNWHPNGCSRSRENTATIPESAAPQGFQALGTATPPGHGTFRPRRHPGRSRPTMPGHRNNLLPMETGLDPVRFDSLASQAAGTSTHEGSCPERQPQKQHKPSTEYSPGHDGSNLVPNHSLPPAGCLLQRYAAGRMIGRFLRETVVHFRKCFPGKPAWPPTYDRGDASGRLEVQSASRRRNPP